MNSTIYLLLFYLWHIVSKLLQTFHYSYLAPVPVILDLRVLVLLDGALLVVELREGLIGDALVLDLRSSSSTMVNDFLGSSSSLAGTGGGATGEGALSP